MQVYVASNDQSLNLEMDESYSLSVDAPTSTLSVENPSSPSVTFPETSAGPSLAGRAVFQQRTQVAGLWPSALALRLQG